MRIHFLYCLLLCANLCFAGVLDKKVSLSIDNKPLQEVLELIEKDADVTFSFQSNVIDLNRLVSFSVADMTISDVLLKLLKNRPVAFYALGSQIILYKKKKTSVSAKKQISSTSKKVKNQQKIIVYDTVKVVDSIVIYDTVQVTVVDTVIFNDTIVTEKEAESNVKDKPWIGIKESGSRAGSRIIEEEVYFSRGKVALEEKKIHQYNYSVSIEAHFGNLYFSSGIGYSKLRQDISYELSEVGVEYLSYYEYSLDSTSYYIPGIETVWSYEYDSVLVTRDKPEENIQELSERKILHFLTLPISWGYNYPISEQFSAGLSVGATSRILLKAKGKTVDVDKLQFVDFNTASIPQINLSLLVMPTINYNVSPKLTFSINPFADYYVNSVSALHDRKLLLIGFHSSFLFKL